MKSKSIYTTWKDGKHEELVTELIQSDIRDLAPGEILVKVLYVPVHGSFWLATDPGAIHPRIDEFMSHGGFVFGNGGVGVVVDSREPENSVQIGDYVAIWGHVPCTHYDCYGCSVLHRYTECDYGESSIIGHGKTRYNGTYSEYVILPRLSYDLCYSRDEKPSETDLKKFMFAFLVADVRNALTRNSDALRMPRMLLLGAGFTGMIAAYLFSKSAPGSKLFIVDVDTAQLNKVRDLIGENVETYEIPHIIAEQLNSFGPPIGFRNQVREFVDKMARDMLDYFDGKGVNLVFDSSSGNTAPLWDNVSILEPNTIAIPFGFGSEYIIVSKDLIQTSGLTLVMSRGVGNIRNRKEVVQLIKQVGDDFILPYLVDSSNLLKGLDEANNYFSCVREKEKTITSNQKFAYIDLT